MLTLRETADGDVPAVAALEAEVDTASWLGRTGEAWHYEALADRGQEHLIAEIGRQMVGFAVIAGIGSTEIELRRMVIAPEKRGTGLGRELLRVLTERAYRVHDARLVWLDVKPGNARARKLYESEGFAAVRTVSGAVPEPDGSASDLLVMAHVPDDG